MFVLDIQDPLPVPLTPSQQKTFMLIVGSVLFLSTRSHPDLSFSVNYLSLVMTKATQYQLVCYKRFKHIWQSKDLTLNLFDSSYASHSDRKSHCRVSVHMNSNSGSCIFISEKSTSIAWSSTKTECISVSLKMPKLLLLSKC